MRGDGEEKEGGSRGGREEAERRRFGGDVVKRGTGQLRGESDAKKDAEDDKGDGGEERWLWDSEIIV